MDFRAALVNNINVKPFVPANPPRYPAHLSVQRVQGEDGKPQGDTPARRRRRRRHNAAKRQELAAIHAGQDQPSSSIERPSRSAAVKPIIPSASLVSLPTPPESRVHTPLRAEFSIPQIAELMREEKVAVEFSESKIPHHQQAASFTEPQQVEVEDVPVLRLLQATPVHPPFPYSDVRDKIPIATLQAIASRAQSRLVNRIQAYQEEQQNVIATATRIQEAYSSYLGERLDAISLEMKSHLNAELESHFAIHDQRLTEELQRFKTELNQTTASSVGSGLEGEAMLAILGQLRLHSEQIQAVFIGLKQTENEFLRAVGGMKAVMEGFGLLPPTPPLLPEGRRMSPVPMFGSTRLGDNGVLANANINAPLSSTPSVAPKITMTVPAFTPKQAKSNGIIGKSTTLLADGKENAMESNENEMLPRLWAQEGRL